MGKKSLAILEDVNGLLKQPGDEISARITKSGRKVLKVKTKGGTHKYSAVQYKNGRVVETKSTPALDTK